MATGWEAWVLAASVLAASGWEASGWEASGPERHRRPLRKRGVEER